MTVNVRIDRLIVEGVELSHRERRELLETVQDELRALLTTPRPRGERHPAQGAGAPATGIGAAQLGRHVAEGIHRAITPLPVQADRPEKPPRMRSGAR